MAAIITASTIALINRIAALDGTMTPCFGFIYLVD